MDAGPAGVPSDVVDVEPPPEEPVGEVLPSQLTPGPRAVFDTEPLEAGHIATLWTWREGEDYCADCVGIPEQCEERCIRDHLMLTVVDERGAPQREFLVTMVVPNGASVGLNDGALALQEGRFVIAWQMCAGQSRCEASLRVFDRGGVPATPRVPLYDSRMARIGLAVHEASGRIGVLSSRVLRRGREASTGVGFTVLTPGGEVTSPWTMVSSASAGIAAIDTNAAGFWLAFSDPDGAHPDPTCAFCEALPCDRPTCTDRSTESQDLIVVGIDVDGREFNRFEALREPDGQAVPIWDGVDLSAADEHVLVGGVVGWGAQTEGLVDPNDMGLWNPGLSLVEVRLNTGQSVSLQQERGVAFGLSFDRRASVPSWVLHDSVVAPGGLDEDVIAFVDGELVSTTSLTNAFTAPGTVSFIDGDGGRLAVGYARDLVGDDGFFFYRAPLRR
ncbi:MAG: hypothetical protein ACJAYU_004081 [Bradymonadia bacterium]